MSFTLKVQEDSINAVQASEYIMAWHCTYV